MFRKYRAQLEKLWTSHIFEEQRKKIFNFNVKAVLLYASESWIMAESECLSVNA